MARILNTAVLATMVLGGCSRDTTHVSSNAFIRKDAMLKVAVFVDGKTTADGEPVDLDVLARKMEIAKKVNATVLYYREASDKEPHPNAIKVMELVVQNKLPISLSTKADYSDVVGPDGIPHTR